MSGDCRDLEIVKREINAQTEELIILSKQIGQSMSLKTQKEKNKAKALRRKLRGK